MAIRTVKTCPEVNMLALVNEAGDWCKGDCLISHRFALCEVFCGLAGDCDRKIDKPVITRQVPRLEGMTWD